MNEARQHTDQHDTKHAWQTLELSLGSVLLRCSRCGTQTNNALLASIHPCPGERAATEVAHLAHETAQTFAAKLREIGYQEPILPRGEALKVHCEDRSNAVLPAETKEQDEGMRRYLAACTEYRRLISGKPRLSLWGRCKVWLLKFWNRCNGGLVLLLSIRLTVLGCVSLAESAEVGYWTQAEVTAYCPCDKCTDGDKVTANGTRTDSEPYALAADRSLKFGTQVYIQPGLGVLDNARADDRWFTVDDRGGALETESRERQVLRLDLRVKEHWWARKFGRRLLPVFIAN